MDISTHIHNPPLQCSTTFSGQFSNSYSIHLTFWLRWKLWNYRRDKAPGKFINKCIGLIDYRSSLRAPSFPPGRNNYSHNSKCAICGHCINNSLNLSKKYHKKTRYMLTFSSLLKQTYWPRQSATWEGKIGPDHDSNHLNHGLVWFWSSFRFVPNQTDQ